MKLRIAAALLCAAGIAQAQTPTAPQTFPGYMEFRGRLMAVLSDADMVASAYLDDALGPRAPGMGDRLTLFRLGQGAPQPLGSVEVSNAVTAWPSGLALSADGGFAYVAETDRPPPAGATRRGELPPGPGVSVVDLRDPARPRVVQQVELAGRTAALALSGDGRTLLVSSLAAPGGRVLATLPVAEDGRLGAAAFLSFPDLPAEEASPHIAVHPSGRFLAATFPGRDETRFYRLEAAGPGRVTLAPFGQVLRSGRFPGVGHWTPDGRHLLVTHLHWSGGAADEYVGAGWSTMAALAFDAEGGRHQIVSIAPVGASAEEFAISPDGRWVVTLNMEESFLPPGDARLSYHSSLTLLERDAASGRLEPRHTLPFEGILPEGIAFDASGRFLAVANFAHFNPARPIAETTVEIFRLVQGPRPMLVQTDARLPVMRGAHVIRVLP
jgi:DNA-binding beta-propeller fold protein YncE